MGKTLKCEPKSTYDQVQHAGIRIGCALFGILCIGGVKCVLGGGGGGGGIDDNTLFPTTPN